MNNKISHALAGAILFGLIVAVTVFLAELGGYWLAAIAATIGAYLGVRVAQERNTDIPEDWYNDVGDVSKDFGKTKH